LTHEALPARKMAGPDRKKPREWFISDKHDDILESTMKFREREERLLKSSLMSKEKSALEKVCLGTRRCVKCILRLEYYELGMFQRSHLSRM
jgi:hypothetical protein